MCDVSHLRILPQQQLEEQQQKIEEQQQKITEQQQKTEEQSQLQAVADVAAHALLSVAPPNVSAVDLLVEEKAAEFAQIQLQDHTQDGEAPDSPVFGANDEDDDDEPIQPMGDAPDLGQEV